MNSNIPHINAQSCAAITAASHSSFARAFGVLTIERQQGLAIVYAIFRILDDCVDELDQPQDQIAALDYWQERLHKAFQGNPDHPITQELMPVANRFGIPQEYFSGLIDGCRMDIDKKEYATTQELYQYCYHVASLVGLCCLKIFEYQSDTAEKMAIDLGQALQITNILRDVCNDFERGRIYLPQDLLQKHGYTKEQLSQHVKNAAFESMMNELADLAESYYQSAAKEFAMDQEGKLNAARIMAISYHALLVKMRRQHWPVFGKKVVLGFWDKAKIFIAYTFGRNPI